MILAETAPATPSSSMVWLVLIALFSIGSNLATIVMAFAAFRRQKTEVSFSPNYVLKPDFERHEREQRADSMGQWEEINGLKKDIGQIPDRLFALLANAGVIERKAPRP